MNAHPTHTDPGLSYVFHRLHDDETALVAHLIKVGVEYHSEHEIDHVSRDLLVWSRDNLVQIVDTAGRYKTGLNSDADIKTPLRLDASPSTAVDGHPAAGLRLLEDLRTTFLLASATSLSWELLVQHAQARRESDILGLARHCHPRTLRQMRWANTMLKTLAPQTLTNL